MASILKVDSMQGVTSAGDITITSEGGAATMQLQQGVVKVWCDNGGSGSNNDSFNVSSATDNGTGDFSINFDNAMSAGIFATGLTAENSTVQNTSIHQESMSSTSITLVIRVGDSGSNADKRNFTTIHGDLA